MAAIDVGSSATRLVVARPQGDRMVTLARQRTAVRLGTEAFAGGRIGATSVAQLVQAFADMGERLRHMRVVRYSCVATSALRDAANGVQVVDAIYARSGLRVQIISGDEEAELMRQALLTAYGRHVKTPPPGDVLLLDLGGGSLELMRANGQDGRSLALGTVRLLARYPQLAGPMQPEAVAALGAELQEQLGAWVGRAQPRAPFILGTGGNVEAMALWLGDGPQTPPRLRLSALMPAARMLGPLTLAARGRAYGLHPPARADLLLPALLVMHAVSQTFAVDQLVVPGAGIRDALLAHLGRALKQRP